MTYKLTADIGDMSIAEAQALIRAIVKKYGIGIVDAAKVPSPFDKSIQESIEKNLRAWSGTRLGD